MSGDFFCFQERCVIKSGEDSEFLKLDRGQSKANDEQRSNTCTYHGYRRPEE